MKTLNVFPRERAIVSRERAKGSYAAAPYFLAKLAAESPVGALFPLLFAAIVYPAAGLHPKLSRCAPSLRGLLYPSLGYFSSVGCFMPSAIQTSQAARLVSACVRTCMHAWSRSNALTVRCHTNLFWTTQHSTITRQWCLCSHFVSWHVHDLTEGPSTRGTLQLILHHSCT